ncbi:MAG: Flp family type IVb pilin [Bacteriovoracia bacterium]
MQRLRSFLTDESGQATTEYVVFLVILIGIIIAVGFALREAILRLLQSRVGGLASRFFNPNSMYRFPFRP